MKEQPAIHVFYYYWSTIFYHLLSATNDKTIFPRDVLPLFYLLCYYMDLRKIVTSQHFDNQLQACIKSLFQQRIYIKFPGILLEEMKALRADFYLHFSKEKLMRDSVLNQSFLSLLGEGQTWERRLTVNQEAGRLRIR